jgi:ABC-type multidrug transport system ATPase subunit/nucleoside-diphosphate-sugar epimerase
VTGTENVLAACRAGGVPRLVYTSSPSVVFNGRDMENIDESVPYPEHYEAPYPQTKALAEQLVLKANGSTLATVALRPHLIWGPGDHHLVPRIVERGRSGKLRKVGFRANMVDAVYIDNAAEAHLLAADCLAPDSPIAGKVYFIAQGEPLPLWDLVNRILAAAGAPPVTRRIPAKLAYALGWLLETAYRTLGWQDEPPMTRFLARELATAHWFNLDAARRDLGYQPRISLEEGLRRLAESYRGVGVSGQTPTLPARPHSATMSLLQPSQPTAQEPLMATPILEVIDVRKRYGNTVALEGVSFQIAEGEMFGLLGPNGAGKTTLLSIVSSLLEADSGEVRILGHKLVPQDRDLRRLIGIVPQDLAIYGELTAHENLAFFGSLYGLRASELEHRITDILQAIGLSERADDRAEGFSGGMKRRLNLGAALVHQPRLLLLDEPTTGVDPQSRNHIFEEVRRLNDNGVTIVYTSHYMEEVEALCRRIGIIDHGRLIACDSLSDLLKQMNGLIRFRVKDMPSTLFDRLQQLPDARLARQEGRTLDLECRDVQATLLRLVSILQELHLELTRLDLQEPNLERVFLQLTGRGLRD